MRILQVLFLLGSIAICPVWSQTSIADTVIYINDIEIKASRLNQHYNGGTVVKIDSSILANYNNASLAQLLGDATGTSIRAYGPSGLATVAIRGGGSSHTAVIWNGLNLQSPMNGGVNLSVLPVSLLNNITVQYGGSGTLYGSGSLSGAIHLTNDNMAITPSQTILSIHAGSFGMLGAGFVASGGDKKQSFRIGAIAKGAENNFTFKNTAQYSQPKQKQSNAQMSQNGASADYEARFSDAIKINASFLFSHNNINIPTMMTNSNEGNESQTDNNLLSTIGIRYLSNKNIITLRTGLIFNQVIYNNPSLPNPTTNNQSSSIINEVEYKFIVNNHHTLSLGVNQAIEDAQSGAYKGNNIERIRNSFFAFHKLKALNNNLEWTNSVRNENVKGKKYPPVFGSGFDFHIAPFLTLKACAATVYRIPTFNDLYWFEAFAKGNPLLKPESGYTSEATLEQNFVSNKIHYSISQSIFLSKYKNYIAWLPNNEAVWVPENKNRGKSEGIELRIKAKINEGIHNIWADVSYTYNRSIIESNDLYNRRPMIYIPLHKANLAIGYSVNNFSAIIQTNYTGTRNYDYTNQLQPYSIVNIHLSQSIKLGNQKLSAQLHGYNLTGTSYQVMAWYAMPLQNFSAGLQLTF